MKIIIVDDEPFSLKILARQFSLIGYESVTLCERAHDALSLLENTTIHYDLICCDLQMPEMDGVEFVRHLGRIGYAGKLILISGEDGRILQTTQLLAKAQQLNVLGVLPKPVAPDILEKLLREDAANTANPAQATHKMYPADELLWAIAEGQLVNYYQPKVDVMTGAVVGVEALVRWQHPEDGLVLPDQFIGTAEKHELIDDLTRTVLTNALGDVHYWHSIGLPFQIAINIPIEHLNSLDFPDYVARMVEKRGLPRSTVLLEVTESGILNNSLLSLDILARLRLKHISLSIDDFGSCHASLNQLRNIPFNEIKINKTFVHGASKEAPLNAIYMASLELARQLGMRTVAEGVEDRDDWDFVRASGCEFAQGYFIAKPMPSANMADWVADWEDRQRGLFVYPEGVNMLRNRAITENR